MRKSCCNYPVEFVDDVFGESPVLAETLAKTVGETAKVMIVADANVVQQTQGLGKRIGAYLNTHGITLASSPLVLQCGEKIKADEFRSVLSVVSAILDSRIGQNDAILAIGGGTLLDVVGYAASQVRGGMKLVRIPTTPAAMVGSVHSGFAAVDVGTVKDALKVASEPMATIIDAGFGKSVLEGVWRGGISEAIRIGLTCDASATKQILELAPKYCQHDLDALRKIAEITNGIVAKKGLPKFAEWSALRLESMSNYKLPHGYAVSIGIWIELLYSLKTGNISQKDYDTVIGTMKKCSLIDGIINSRYLLRQGEQLICGIDAVKLSSGVQTLTIPTGIGKGMEVEEPNRAIYLEVFNELATLPTEG